MVKINVLQHAPSAHLPTRPGDPTPTSRNLDPLQHPFARARERTRALNAVKMERMFAKPFLASLEGHIDAIECMKMRPGSLSEVASGSWDGEIIKHDLSTRTKALTISQAHKGKISGICYGQNSENILSCGVDRNVKLWDSEGKALSTFTGKTAFNAIDHHFTDGLFATASNSVQIWDETKSTALLNLAHSLTTETITSLRFHHSEPSILGSIGSSRTFTLYDIRSSSPIERQIVMSFQNTAIHFSPLFPTQLLLPSEDHNIYTFDLRHLKAPTEIYKGHVASATCAAYSPTGLEFVSGSWDRTIKIWNVKDTGGASSSMSGGKSWDTYHTKRMQRLTAVCFTPDAQHILSASDDGNIRIWKADASKKMGIVTTRERAAIEYRKALIGRWKQDKEVNKVERRRFLPKSVYQAGKLKKTMVDARKEKEDRRRKHTREGENKKKAERKKVVVTEQA